VVRTCSAVIRIRLPRRTGVGRGGPVLPRVRAARCSPAVTPARWMLS